MLFIWIMNRSFYVIRVELRRKWATNNSHKFVNARNFPTEKLSELVYFKEKDDCHERFNKNPKMKKKINWAFNLLNIIFGEKLWIV